MRVTHLSMYQQGINAISRTQTEVIELQTQVATGKRFFNPSDDPFAATRSLQLTRAIEQLDQYQRNADHADHRLSLEDDVLGQVVDTLQRINELAVQANNDSETIETREFIAVEIEQLRTQLIELANTGDGEGGFLFSGYRSETRPFADNAGAISYRGDQGTREIKIGPSRSIPDGDSGAAVFLQVPNGNGTFTTTADPANTGAGIIEGGSVIDITQWDDGSYALEFTSESTYEVRDAAGTLVTSGTYDSSTDQSIQFRGIEVVMNGAPASGDRFDIAPSTHQDLFATVQNFVDALQSPSDTEASRTVLHNRLNNVLTDLDQAFGHLSEARARVGARLRSVDNQRALNDDNALLLQATLSSVEDVDLVEAISQLDLKLQTLEAAQQSYVAVQQMSLFSFI